VARETTGEKVVLPIWHSIGADQIREYSPSLADRVAISSKRGLKHVVSELLKVLRPRPSFESGMTRQLPNRPRAHVLEALSRWHVESNFPAEWICNSAREDYGLDLRVEIVAGEDVIGLEFSLQLKATDHLKIAGEDVVHRCNVSTAQYFLRRPEPVMYVVYDAQGKTAYWLWIQPYLRQLDKKRSNWRNNKTVQIRLPLANRLSSESIPAIANYVRSWWERMLSEAKWDYVPIFQEAKSPFTLPPDLPTFTGRDDLWATLDELLHPGGGTTIGIVGLKGMAGVGKSVLAIHAAHRWCDRFPDGIIWNDLRGARGACAPLRSIARLYGYHDQAARLGEDPQALAALIRTILRDKQVLLILDNAEDLPSDELECLLLGVPGSVTVVTSRRAFPALGRLGRQLWVDVMDDGEALTLLGRLVGDEKVKSEHDTYRRLAERLGHLPLALDIAGRRMRDRGWEPSEMLRRLEEAADRLAFLSLPTAEQPEDSVALSFALSYEALDESDKELFRALSPFAPSGFTPQAVASVVARADERSAEMALDRLTALSLVRQAEKKERYDLHPLLRDYTVALAGGSGEERKYRLRMVEYFFSYTQSYGRSWRTYDRLEPEVQNILAATEWSDLTARETGESKLWHLLNGIGENTRDFLRARGYWDEQRMVLRYSVEASRNLREWESLGLHASYLGWLYCRRGELDRAERWASECLDAMRQTQKQYNVAVGSHLLGMVSLRRRDYGKAQMLLASALNAIRKSKDLVEVSERFYDNFGAVQGDFGVLAYERGEYKLAEQRFTKALEYAEEMGDAEGIAVVLAHLAGAVHRLGNLARARQLYREAIQRAQKIGRLSTLARCKRGLAEVQEEDGKLLEAFSLARESIRAYAQLGRARDVEKTRKFMEQIRAQIL